MGGWTRVPNSL